MHTIQGYCEELIREVMCDVYIPNNKKKEYTEEIAFYIHQVNEARSKAVHNKEVFVEKFMEPIEYREKINESVIKVISILTALLTTVTTIFTTKYIELDEKMQQIVQFPFKDKELIWIAIIMAVFSVALVMIISVLSSKSDYRRIEKNEKKKEDK